MKKQSCSSWSFFQLLNAPTRWPRWSCPVGRMPLNTRRFMLEGLRGQKHKGSPTALPSSPSCHLPLLKPSEAFSSLLKTCDSRQLSGHLLELPGLEEVADLDVHLALEEDAALQAFLDLPRVVLDPLEARDPHLGDAHTPADDADGAVAADGPLRDHASGHHPGLGNLEELAHLGAADERLLDGRLQQPFDGRRDGIHQLVDDLVDVEVDPLGRGEDLDFRLDADVEADDDGIRGDGEDHVGLVDVAHPDVQHLEVDLLLLGVQL